MKRSSFIKAFILAVTSPKILAAASIDKDIVPITDKLLPSSEPNLSNDYLLLYTENGEKYKVGDIIQSDLGDKAVVTTKMVYFPDPKYTRLDCRPVKMGVFRYKDINKFKLIQRMYELS